MDFAIIGTGAIGGYYGARLAHGGQRVRFLARGDYAALKAHGLAVDSHLGDFSLDRCEVYDRAGDMPPSDVVCLTAKATANEVLFPVLGGLLKPGGAILVMQNGFGAEQELAALYPEAAVLAGLCFICAFRDGPGRVRHTAYGRVSLAALTAGDPALAAVAEAFAGCGVDTEVLGDVVTARLRKLVWNLPYNGLSVVMDCDTDQLANVSSLQPAVRLLMDEVVAAAAAGGVAIEPGFVDQMMGTVDHMPAYSPSMRLDWRHGRPLEIEAIYSRVIDYAAAHGFDMRAARLLRSQLEFCQERGPKPNQTGFEDVPAAG